MTKAILGLAVCVLFSAVSRAVPQDRSFTGEIMDNACAAMGGHATMQQKDQTLEQCTRACVKNGAKYVLFDANAKMTYQLDDQQKPDAFAGAQVVVTGTLDEATGTIHIVTIKAAK